MIRNGTITKKVFNIAVLFTVVLAAACLLVPARAFAADSGIPDGYDPVQSAQPHAKMRDIFETETIEVSGIRIVEKSGGDMTDPEDPVHFRIYNTTTQETELEVDSFIDEEGKSWLPAMDLKRYHDYIFYAEDEFYRYPRGGSYPSASKVYVQIREGNDFASQEGPGAYNYLVSSLQYDKVKEIVVERRESMCDDPFEENRYRTLNEYQTPIKVYYKGNIRPGIRFRLVSDVETIETATDSEGRLDVSLIEGVIYMVYVESDRYSIDPFPITAKDKTEGNEGLYCYNHSTCVKVANIILYDKGDTVFDGLSRNTTVRSLMGRSSVTGMNFKNFLLIDRVLNETVDGLSGKNYEVLSFTAVNPTRWELSKLLGTDFSITWKNAGDRLAKHVYYIKDEGLTEVGFSQTSSNDVTFTMDSLSLYPVVIEYDSDRTYSDIMAEKRAAKEAAARAAAEAKAKSVTTVTVNTSKVSAASIDKAVRAAGGSENYVTKIILGKKVKSIKAKAFSKYTKVTQIELKTKKLTKKSVKKALQGSKVKTIRVKLSGDKKKNKSYIKKYKKIFTKKNTGRKVRIK